MKLVDLVAVGMDPSIGVPLVVLQEHDEPHRLLPIAVGEMEVTSIALAAAGQEPPRPLAHDLLAAVIVRLGATLEAIEISGFDEETFHARLRLRSTVGTQILDARPSDAIALAVRLGVPVLVSEGVLEAAGIQIQVVSDDSFDETVADFRAFLDEIDPAHFAQAVTDDLPVPPAERTSEPNDPEIGPTDT